MTETEQPKAGSALPLYRSHKVVAAAKIVGLGQLTDGKTKLALEAPGDPSVLVADDYVQKHRPMPGGYYVCYPDGYESFSPAAAFEDGYTPCTTAEATAPDPVAPAMPSIEALLTGLEQFFAKPPLGAEDDFAMAARHMERVAAYTRHGLKKMEAAVAAAVAEGAKAS